MKLSTVTVKQTAEFLRLEDEEYDDGLLTGIMAAARAYIAGYTGIPAEGEGETLDDHEDITVAFLVLCQDMYDNRTLYVDSANVNLAVQSILDMHSVNLLPSAVKRDD